MELVTTITPTVSQRDLKSAFWVAYRDTPFCDPSNITAAEVTQLTGNTSVSKWWNQPGFKEWFCNDNEYEIKLESAKQKAIDILEDIASNVDVSPAIRVQAARAMLDENARTAKKKKEVEQELTPEQVREIIRVQAPRFLEKP